MTTNAAAPRYATFRSPCGTAVPPIPATTAMAGSARTVAVVAAHDAATPEATLCGGIPARTSIPYWRALAAAAPPGKILVAALLASCDVPTANQLLVWKAIRCSVQYASMLTPSKKTARPSQSGSSSRSWGQDEKISSRLGRSR